MKRPMSASSMYLTMILIPVAFLTAGCELIGGLMPSRHEVIVDESTVEPELKKALAQAKKLTLIASDKSDNSAAIYLEKQGGYEVDVVGFPGVPTPSSIRKYMETICVGSHNPDLVIYRLFDAPVMGSGVVIQALMTGRASIESPGTSDVLRCRDMWKTHFSLRAEINQGVHNVDQVNMDQTLGNEYAKALMRIGGKLQP